MVQSLVSLEAVGGRWDTLVSMGLQPAGYGTIEAVISARTIDASVHTNTYLASANMRLRELPIRSTAIKPWPKMTAIY